MPPCPVWPEPEPISKLPDIVAGLAEYYRFIISACRKHYIIAHGDLKTFHKKVFVKVVPLDYYAGNYRSDDKSKPCLAKEVTVAGVLGESFRTVPQSMGTFSAELHDMILHTDDYLNMKISPTERAQAVAQLAAAAMARFICIHPFLNGNGRMARMLVNYVFKRYGYKMPFVESHRRPPEVDYAQASAAAMGPNSNPSQLYVYLLRLVAQSALV